MVALRRLVDVLGSDSDWVRRLLGSIQPEVCRHFDVCEELNLYRSVTIGNALGERVFVSVMGNFGMVDGAEVLDQMY